MNMIKMVWDLLSKGQNEIPVQEVIGNFTAQKHPQVLSGEKTEQQIFREFVTNFENAGNVASKISWEGFADFYASVSAGIPYNDDYFVKMMECSWGVVESSTSTEVPSALLRKVENVLREKIRQRTKSESSESETLRKAFKQQDLENCGMISYNDFLYALEFFGIVLEPMVRLSTTPPLLRVLAAAVTLVLSVLLPNARIVFVAFCVSVCFVLLMCSSLLLLYK